MFNIPLTELFIFLTLDCIIHELGHFLVAKYYKFNVKEFSIGAGPTIFNQKFGETNFILKMLLPLGGHIRVDFNLRNLKKMDSQKILKIIAVALAGPLVNIIFAALTFKLNPNFALLSLLTGVGNLIPFSGTDGLLALKGSIELSKRNRKQ